MHPLEYRIDIDYGQNYFVESARSLGKKGGRSELVYFKDINLEIDVSN